MSAERDRYMKHAKRREQYLNNPTACPYCDSENIVAGEFQIGGVTSVFQAIQCSQCCRTWTDEYTLTGITESETIPHVRDLGFFNLIDTVTGAKVRGRLWFSPLTGTHWDVDGFCYPDGSFRREEAK